MKVWKKIDGYDSYSVSSDGDIRNDITGKLKKPTPTRTGYMRVCLSKNGIHKYKYVHRIVASAFIENPLCKSEVNHMDGNKNNNNVSNLEWATHSENQKHRFTALGHKYTEEQMRNMRNGALKWHMKRVRCIDTGVVYESIKIASVLTGASKAGISQCANNRLKTSGKLMWEWAV